MLNQRFTFTGPHVAISCETQFDMERKVFAAEGSGFQGTGDSAEAAALNCFRAWLTNDHGWFVPRPEEDD